MGSVAAPSTKGPGCKIVKLDETVINRIAAGEVIQRPANALKELLENSLDAGSKNITVTVRQGGLKLLQIQDDGSGIRREDMEIVCERFTTSKLSKFEDLLSIGTYGFRGEALASISHVAHLTITTKTQDSNVGYKASYEDGKLKETPKAVAALQGTLIRVDDLFYNVATRRKALKNPTDEFNRIFEVVSRYAVHNHKVSFTLKKEGSNNADVKTQCNSTAEDNIRIIYGSNAAKALMPVTYTDDVLKVKVTGCITNVNYSEKKLTLLLFINHRLVDSSALRKIIEHTYSSYLPKGPYKPDSHADKTSGWQGKRLLFTQFGLSGSHPLVYLSLELHPAQVDVNVHPTKHEVHFLHEDAILDKVRDALATVLAGSNASRTLYTQAKLPVQFSMSALKESEPSQKELPAAQKTIPTYPQETVRSDPREQKIDKFLKEPASSGSVNASRRDIKLASILSLRGDVQNAAHEGLLKMLRATVFVGVVSPTQILLQHDTKLYICRHDTLAFHLFYQIVLMDFCNFGVIKFTSTLPITELVMMYLNGPDSEWTEDDGPKEELAEEMQKLLTSKASMLDDYFSIEITEDGSLASLPLLLEQHIPDMTLLPDFVVRVCTEVDWNLERPCLDGFAKELARLYSHVPPLEREGGDQWRWQMEHIITPAMKTTLLPPAECATDGTFLQIADLPELYRVFERC